MRNFDDNIMFFSLQFVDIDGNLVIEVLVENVKLFEKLLTKNLE